MDQTIDRVHYFWHVGHLSGEPRFTFKPKLLDVGFQNRFHAPATNDQESRIWNLLVNFRCGSKKFTLSFAARQIKSTSHSQCKIIRLQTELLAHRLRRRWTKFCRIDA